MLLLSPNLGQTWSPEVSPHLVSVAHVSSNIFSSSLVTPDYYLIKRGELEKVAGDYQANPSGFLGFSFVFTHRFGPADYPCLLKLRTPVVPMTPQPPHRLTPPALLLFYVG